MIINARKRGRDIITLKQVESGFEVAWNGEVIARDSDFTYAFNKFMEV